MPAQSSERDAMIRRYLPLARHCARRYRRGPEPLEDLEQVASLALIRAVDGFDPQRGTAFSSYAVPCIAGAIKRHFRDSGWAIHVPRDLKDLALRVERLASEAPRPVTAAELAERSGASVEAVVDAREAYRFMLADSLDRPRAAAMADDGDPVSVLDFLGEEDAGLERVCDRATLDAVLTELDDRDQLLVTLYYRRGQTQSQIGQQLGYSQMHVSRLLRRAVERLELAVAA
jgi:RNA polymerase sigma-B factor